MVFCRFEKKESVCCRHDASWPYRKYKSTKNLLWHNPRKLSIFALERGALDRLSSLIRRQYYIWTTGLTTGSSFDVHGFKNRFVSLVEFAAVPMFLVQFRHFFFRVTKHDFVTSFTFESIFHDNRSFLSLVVRCSRNFCIADFSIWYTVSIVKSIIYATSLAVNGPKKLAISEQFLNIGAFM